MRFILISCYLLYYVSVSDSKNGTEKLPAADTNFNNAIFNGQKSEPKSEPQSEPQSEPKSEPKSEQKSQPKSELKQKSPNVFGL